MRHVNQIVKNVVWTIVALAILGYFVNSYFEKRARRNAQEAEAQRIEETIKSAVSDMVSRTGAVDDWERRLSKGKRFRFDPVLTIELEDLWLREPILFIGSIKDIITYDDVYYTVLLEQNLFANFDYMFDTELQLSLRADRQRIEAFLKEHAHVFNNFGLDNGVAVIANVTSISTSHLPTEEGREEVKIVEGELVDIVFSGRTRFWDIRSP